MTASERDTGRPKGSRGPQEESSGPAALDAGLVRRGLVAALLAWILPGAGHWYVGARQRAAVFFTLIAACLVLGTVFDGNLYLVDSRTPVLSRLQVASNLAIGPWEPLLRAALYGSPAYVNDESYGLVAPERRVVLEARRERMFRKWSGYGTIYLVGAGLMNLLLIFDAWDIGIRRKP